MAFLHRFTALAALLVSATGLPAQTTGPIISVTFQQGGRGTTVSSGGSVTMIAPGVGRATTGTVTITYTGTAKLTFPSDPELIGSTDFSLQAPSPMPTLTPLQSVSFNVQFKPTFSQASSALIALRFQDTTTNGQFTLNLTGTVSNVIVSYVLPFSPSATIILAVTPGTSLTSSETPSSVRLASYSASTLAR